MIDKRENNEFEWHCTGCNALLGAGRQGRLYISFAGGFYAAELPVEAVCARCNCYNETTFVVVR